MTRMRGLWAALFGIVAMLSVFGLTRVERCAVPSEDQHAFVEEIAPDPLAPIKTKLDDLASHAGGFSKVASACTAALLPPYDYLLLIGMGQSLSIGFGPTHGSIGHSEGFNNLGFFSDAGINPTYSWDANDPSQTLIPIVSPPLGGTDGGGTLNFPLNTMTDEPPTKRMADEITRLGILRGYPDYRVIVIDTGIGGTTVSCHLDGGSGCNSLSTAINATSYAVAKIRATCPTCTVGVGAVLLVDGEADCVTSNFSGILINATTWLPAALQAATAVSGQSAQTRTIPIIYPQQHSCAGSSAADLSSNYQLIADQNSGTASSLVMSGTGYQYGAGQDNTHFFVTSALGGYREMGALAAAKYWLLQDFYSGASTKTPHSLSCTSVTRSGNNVTCHTNLTNATIAGLGSNLVRYTGLYAPHQSGTYATAWSSCTGGFEMWTGGGAGPGTPVTCTGCTATGADITCTGSTQPDSFGYSQIPDVATAGRGTPNGRGGQWCDDASITDADGFSQHNCLAQGYWNGLRVAPGNDTDGGALVVGAIVLATILRRRAENDNAEDVDRVAA